MPQRLLEDSHLIWAFVLLICRFSGMIMVLPGIGGGERGYVVRYPAVIVLAFAALKTESALPLPTDWALLLVQLLTEFTVGLAIGIIPFIAIAGIQMAGMLSSTSMGLGAGNLIDPTLGAPTSDLARIYSDLSVVLFLMLGGHHAVIYAVSGYGGQLVPGTLILEHLDINLLIDLTSNIFQVGVMVAAPVLVALLLTQFVMGLISKAVPTVNVFIVSFPLTIGIGLILSMLSLPEIFTFLQREFATVDQNILQVIHTQ
ncbi:MAG: flagellar biosynthetic protein FliR [Oligoflexia bacterium]|nr:flagellar biosynthetic protein FliR [Oligoflexia bacterium]